MAIFGFFPQKSFLRLIRGIREIRGKKLILGGQQTAKQALTGLDWPQRKTFLHEATEFAGENLSVFPVFPCKILFSTIMRHDYGTRAQKAATLQVTLLPIRKPLISLAIPRTVKSNVKYVFLTREAWTTDKTGWPP